MTTATNKPWVRGPPARYRLVDCTLIDPKDGAVHPRVVVDLKDGIVSRMSKLGKWPSPGDEALSWTQGEDIHVVNMDGRFLLPGLIDCHVHLQAAPGETGLKDSINQDHDTNLLRQPYVAREMLRRGFTSVRDCAGAGQAIKEAFAEGLFPAPRLFTSGHGISQTGGHGDLRAAKDAEYACCGGNTRGLGRIADGVEQCLHAAREELRCGADFIKIMVSGGVASPTDKLTSPQYTAEEIRAFTKVAADAGTYVTAHAYTPASIQNAILNGVSGIEHGNLIDEATAKLMAERGVFLTPTLITYSAMASTEFAGFLPPAIAEKNFQVLSAGKRSIQLADAAGVTMCYGSDLLGPMQVKQSGEFMLRKEAGLSALKILQSATVNAARMLRQEEKLGRVKEGFFADLIVLNANPLDDMEVLAHPERHLLAVFKEGRVVESRWSKLPSDLDRVSLIE
ncbi:hypothetical protein BAUCODRAFT_407748 [Baudoinia panamericana UAMH 10762]|uniref:Amidohydrolase-related domain-containing protein n=1 Tax=Baudoinia panamericana (strain UAMH 10762) TaxID=717646 RepID=M2NFA5_BAUPA|nr:uncharacterized protein BAUCODRAFT_407748 [Baudoinia panamericana UAMH 10762]EMC97929.1 hypothetical protein BAUCODRAFT_407748 [Baudoinia panamericana UAMH 10762]